MLDPSPSNIGLRSSPANDESCAYRFALLSYDQMSRVPADV
jgi:hypothetical protein